MSAGAGDPRTDENGSLFDDDWVRDVTKMGIGWLIGTIIAILLLVFVGPQIL
jgi:hypothetical protein